MSVPKLKAIAGSPFTSENSTPDAAEVLRCALGVVFQDENAARLAVMRALRDAERLTVPHDRAAVVAFARAFVARRVEELLGPHAAGAFLAEVEARFDGPPPGVGGEDEVSRVAEVPRDTERAIPIARHRPRTRVLLAGGARFERSLVARALVRLRCDVVTIDVPGELDVLGPDVHAFEIVVVDLDGAGAADMARALAARSPRGIVLARSARPGRRSAPEGIARWLDLPPATRAEDVAQMIVQSVR